MTLGLVARGDVTTRQDRQSWPEASEGAIMAVDDTGQAGISAAAPSTRKAAIGLISWTALALMTVSSVASLRPAPTMAVYGLACVFLYVLPAIVFLIPTALVSAELASGWDGGVYRWV